MLLAMTPGVVLASSASSSGPVCAVMSPLLPSALGCSCVDAASGVGGTSACPMTIPAYTLVQATALNSAIATPAMTFSLGASLLPCGTPASASAHGSITLTLPEGTSLPDDMETTINAVDGVSATVAGTQVTITIEKSVAANGPATTIDIPIATGVVARINLAVYARTTPPRRPHVAALAYLISPITAALAPLAPVNAPPTPSPPCRHPSHHPSRHRPLRQPPLHR